MKIKNYDDDDTVFAFSLDKKNIHIYTNDDSPRRRSKSSAYTVPKYNSNMMEASKKELRNDDTVLALINIIICALSFTQHNIYFEMDYKSTEFVIYIRVLMLILSLSSILWVVRRYQIKLILMLIKYQISVRDTLFSTGLYKKMFLEIAATFLVIPPYIDSTFKVEMLGFKVEYSLSAIFTFLSMVRLYVIIRLFGHYSEYTQEKSEAICGKHAVPADAYFALKCYLQDSPFVGIGGFFFLMSLFSSLAMKLCEEPQLIKETGEVSDSTLEKLWDNMWVIFYTTTTIGYGNLYPVTHLGRAICILACILGNMYLGMLVVSINQKMELDEGQNLSYSWISRKYFRQDVKKNATVAIRKFMTLCLLSKKWPKTISMVKPCGLVTFRGVLMRNDLVMLDKEQYRTKLRVFREMRDALDSLRDLAIQSREVGSSEIDIISNFENAVRIDFPKVSKKIKGKVVKTDIEASDGFNKSCKPAELKALQIKEFSKMFKRKVSHAIRRKTLQVSQGEIVRNQNRSLTNY